MKVAQSCLILCNGELEKGILRKLGPDFFSLVPLVKESGLYPLGHLGASCNFSSGK